MENQTPNKMGTQKMLPLIISMSIPAMFSMVVQALYNIVDSLFVARYSDAALSAVSLAFPVQNLLIGFAVGTGIGINSLIARRLGEKRQEAADASAVNGIFIALCSWVLFALLGLTLLPSYFSMFAEGSPAVLSQALTYTRIVIILSLGAFLETAINKILQATGEMVLPMYAMLVGTVTNIILDPLMIFGLWGFPEMGVAGAALATVIGQWAAMIFNIIVLCAKKHAVHISFKRFRPDWQIIGSIYAVGAPSILMQSVGSVMISLLNLILIKFSEAAVSVLGVYYKLQSFVFMPVFGLNSGVMPIMGFSFGARNKKRYNDCLRIGTLLALGIMLLGLGLFQLIPAQLLSLFNADLVTIGVPALRIVSLCFPLAAVGIMVSTAFQSAGQGLLSLLVSVLRQMVIIVPCAWFLARFGLNYVWYAFPIAEALALVASGLIFRYFAKTTLAVFPAAPPEAPSEK